VGREDAVGLPCRAHRALSMRGAKCDREDRGDSGDSGAGRSPYEAVQAICTVRCAPRGPYAQSDSTYTNRVHAHILIRGRTANTRTDLEACSTKSPCHAPCSKLPRESIALRYTASHVHARHACVTPALHVQVQVCHACVGSASHCTHSAVCHSGRRRGVTRVLAVCPTYFYHVCVIAVTLTAAA
jgi:hypothetical protein